MRGWFGSKPQVRVPELALAQVEHLWLRDKQAENRPQCHHCEPGAAVFTYLPARPFSQLTPEVLWCVRKNLLSFPSATFLLPARKQERGRDWLSRRCILKWSKAYTDSFQTASGPGLAPKPMALRLSSLKPGVVFLERTHRQPQLRLALQQMRQPPAQEALRRRRRPR
jgi:hypothetical protein